MILFNYSSFLYLFVFSVLASETVPVLGEPGNADVDYLKIWLRMFVI